MFNNLLLGRYIQIDSLIHSLDSRTKLLTSFMYIVFVFLVNSWLSYAVLFALLGVAIGLSKIPLRFFIEGVKPIVGLILFTVALQVFFTPGGTVYFEYGIFKLTSFGLLNAFFIFIRFTMIILMSTLLTVTTDPLSIADAIESLLMPLKKVHFPVHELALMLSIAFRFVPTLMDEAQKIMNAQKARGVDFEEGNLVQRIKAIVPILIPLFVSSFNRAEDLAYAMEARGYRGSEGRSKYRILRYQAIDYMTFGIVILTGVLIVTLNYYFAW